MSELPRFGQQAERPRAEFCPRHPSKRAVAYCKRCNRPACADCNIPTEVGSVCVDCAHPKNRISFRPSGGPVVTYSILAICVIVYFCQWILPAVPRFLAFQPYAAFTEPWQFFTVSFVHLGFFHLLFNMFMLYILGAAIEKAIGHWQFASIYLLSAVGGSVAALAWTFVDPNAFITTTVGASGALYGFFGAIFVQQRRSGMSTTSILVLLGINLAFSFMNAGSVSWQSHVGGLIVGGLVAFMYFEITKPRSGRKQSTETMWAVAATIGVAALLYGCAYAMYFALLN